MRIDFENVDFAYYPGKPIIRGLSSHFESGETVALLGRNGAGKTTLFRLLLGILVPKSGDILIEGKSTMEISDKERAKLISYIPQISGAAFPYTVLETVLMGTAPSFSIFSHPGKRENEKAMEALRLFGLEDMKDRTLESLSGGERQMVMIARALAQDSKFVILDEPTSALDYGNQILVLEMLERLRKKGIGLLFSTHNPEMAMRYSQRIIILDECTLHYDGTPDGLVDSDTLEKLYKRELYIRKIQTRKSSGYICIPE